MDAADLDPHIYEQVLTDLARVNRWTFTARPTLAFLRRVIGERTSFSLLDVGFGDGDLLRAIGGWAEKRGIAARLIGVDLNQKSEAIATAKTPGRFDIEYLTGDYLDIVGARERDGGFDFIISSQVAHHMNHAQLQTFLRTMEAKAVKGVHVLGDATLSGPAMPKSASMANNHAKIAAAAIVELLNGRNPEPVKIINTCYSFVSPKEAMRVSSVHEWEPAQGTLVPVKASAGVSAARSEAEGTYAWSWARTIWADTLA